MSKDNCWTSVNYWKTQGPNIGKFLYGNARQIGWIVMTTTIITFLPLYLEVMRESDIEALEESTIQEGLSKGESPFQMAHQKGLTGAIDPDVLASKE